MAAQGSGATVDTRATCIIRLVVLLAMIATVERAIFDAMGNQWTILTGDALNFFFITMCYIGLIFERHSIQWTYVVWAFAWIIFNIVLIVKFKDAGNVSSGVLDFKQGTTSWWATADLSTDPDTVEIIHAVVSMIVSVSFCSFFSFSLFWTFKTRSHASSSS
eukprot:m.137025 g.137025  ORF g.137025 m.137025 type:complete len:162 (-) comp52486_c0_seq4:48-533(-)